MNHKPWGIYVISVVNLLFGLGTIVLTAMAGYFSVLNISSGFTIRDPVYMTGMIFVIMPIFLFFGLGLVGGIVSIDSTFSSYNFKKRALMENTFIAVIALLAALVFLFIDLAVPASRYAGGEKPLFNLPLHILIGIYAIWNLCYLRKPVIRNMFVK